MVAITRKITKDNKRNGPGDNEVRGVVGWSEVAMTMAIQTTIARRIKITRTIQITITN